MGTRVEESTSADGRARTDGQSSDGQARPDVPAVDASSYSRGLPVGKGTILFSVSQMHDGAITGYSATIGPLKYVVTTYAGRLWSAYLGGPGGMKLFGPDGIGQFVSADAAMARCVQHANEVAFYFGGAL